MSSEPLYKLFLSKGSHYISPGEKECHQEGVVRTRPIEHADGVIRDQTIIIALTLKQLFASMRFIEGNLFFAQVTLCEDSVVVERPVGQCHTNAKVYHTNALCIGKIRPISELLADLDESALLDCIQINPRLLQHTPDSCLTAELCCAAVAKDAKQLKYVPMPILMDNYAMCLGAVGRCGSMLKYVPVCTLELYVAAVVSDLSAIQYVPAECRTYELYFAVVKGGIRLDGQFVSKFVPTCFHSREMIVEMMFWIVREMKTDESYDGVKGLACELGELLNKLKGEEEKEKAEGS